MGSQPKRALAVLFSLILTSLILSAGTGRAALFDTGDIVTLDTVGLELYSVDPVSGVRTLISSLPGIQPFGMALDATGDVLLTNSIPREILHLNRLTGDLTTLSSGGFLVNPLDIALEPNGDVLVADQGAGLIRIDPTTGAQTLLASGGFLLFPIAVATAPDGSIYMADFFSDTIVEIDPTTGAQSIVSVGGEVHHPSSLVVDADGSLLVTDANGAFGRDALIRVDPVSGAQQVVSEFPDIGSGPELGYPFGIDLESSGTIVIADTGIAAVVRVDPSTGDRNEVAAGLVRRLRVLRPDCSDGLDNDGDGLVDVAEDPGCASVWDDSETPRRRACGLGAELLFGGAVWSAGRKRVRRHPEGTRWR